MPRATVGTFLVGTRLVGENSLQFGKPQLQLRAKTFSVTVIEGEAVVVLFPNTADLLLAARPVTLRLNQTVPLGKAQLRLVARSFGVEASQSLGLGRPVLTLVGKSYGFVLSQSPAFGKGVLILLGRPPRRVGIPWLLPTVPETVILTPSPAETAAILVPTVVETGLLVPTKVRVG